MRQFFCSFLLVYLFSFVFSPHFTYASNSPLEAQFQPLASKSLLLDITLVDQVRLVAVGQHGNILTSNDAITWQQSSVPVQSTLTSVYFINSLQGWAVGHDATILHTSDGGYSWQVQQYLPNKEKPLLDVTFKDDLNGLAVGAYGLFYRTTDGGQTWHSEFHQEFLNADDTQYIADLKAEDEAAYLDEIASILPHFNRIIQDGRTLYLVGEIGLIAKSNDYGKHWQKFSEVYQGSFFDLARTHQANLLVVGLRGHIFRSLKNGSPWESIASNTTALLNSVVLTDDNRIIILANNGVMLVSRDDGKTYKLQAQKDGKPLIAGVWFNHKLIVVSDVGIKIIKVK
ncbi:MAG: hypothetical protein COB35_03695 [Gammaproteobacteria bacterium]|nr:MAG: hypothetical protein COB35_03695 [Gammaproteobacteria bacterium]